MRLLLAEDERDLSDALVAILKHNNYSVDAVYNGEDALNYLEADNLRWCDPGYHDAEDGRHYGIKKYSCTG